MRLLQRSFDVTTRFGGNFVQEIDGVSGGREAGRRVDWFYYVNGIESSTGAGERKLFPGDRVWWDHHDWETAMRVPAVVGAFPEPFRSGQDGKKLPIRLVCLHRGGRTCDEVEKRLSDAGVRNVARSNLESSPGEVLRILVGKWTDVRKDIASRQLEEGPEVSGVFAKPSPAGTEITLMDADGKSEQKLGPGSGLVAATSYQEEHPTWMVTGTDDVGVAAAAAALTRTSCATTSRSRSTPGGASRCRSRHRELPARSTPRGPAWVGRGASRSGRCRSAASIPACSAAVLAVEVDGRAGRRAGPRAAPDGALGRAVRVRR